MKLYLSLLLAAALAACSSTSTGRDRGRSEADRLAELAALATIPESALGPQTLLPGECGLFLWSKTDPSKFIFFSKAVSGTALITQGAEPIDLTMTRAGGDLFGQFNTEMSYASVAGDEITLGLTPGAVLDGGQRVEAGLITTINSGGWQAKLPVLGVRACQPE